MDGVPKRREIKITELQEKLEEYRKSNQDKITELAWYNEHCICQGTWDWENDEYEEYAENDVAENHRALPMVGTIPVQLIQAIPYVLTVILLAGFVGKAIAPNAIGQPYIKER